MCVCCACWRWLVAAALLSLLFSGTACQSNPNRTGAHDDVNEAAADAPFFEDITLSSGVQFTYRNGEDTANHLSILESLGCWVGPATSSNRQR
jgi:hypothetical protein